MSVIRVEYHCRCGASFGGTIGALKASVGEIERAWLARHSGEGHGSVTAKQAAAARLRREREGWRAKDGTR